MSETRSALTTETKPVQFAGAEIRRRRRIGLVAVVALLGVVCLASLVIGTELVSLGTVWRAVTDYTDTGDEWIVHDLRIPRTLFGIVVGIALGVSGALIQAVFRNPLGDSQILGLNSGASLSVVAAIAVFGFTSVWSYVWFAFVGALVAMVVVYLVATVGTVAATPVRLLLAGVAVGAIMDGVSFTIRNRNPRAFDSMRFWDAGTLDGRSVTVLAAVGPFIIVGLVLALAVSRTLNSVALGDDLATAMGGSVARTQVCSIIAITLLAGAATAAVGPIGFVGLMVPHIVRRLTGPDWRWILAYTVAAAPALLIAADVIGRLVVRPAELAAGIVTAFVGAPVLIWQIRRRAVSES
ncbi:iron chelate uptake ABC transporter family permease subunit [Gordonia malaquae]|uniref:iron chelate uptake ABC transporter family permease subunit n=1 Tax=Gordonia malaquae TaxID=410332 RepID=UPI0030FEED0F